MSTVITVGTQTIMPNAVTEVYAEQVSNTVIHPILGRANPDVTIRPSGTRTGSFELLFTGPSAAADSATARALFASGGVFNATSDDPGSLSLTGIASGRVSARLENVTRAAWLVYVEYTEVTA